MAISFNPGGQSPTSLYRTLEKVFEDAQQTGEINLSSRNLKEYPAIASTYDLSDSNSAGNTDFSISAPGVRLLSID